MLHWTPETRALTLPLRNQAGFPPPARPTAKEAWKVFATKRRSISSWSKPQLDSFLAGYSTRFYGTPDSPDLVADHAIFMALAQSWSGEVTTAWLEWLSVAFEPLYLVQLFVSLCGEFQTTAQKLIYKLGDFSPTLRATTAVMTDAQYQAAVKCIAPLWSIENLEHTIAFAIVYAFYTPPADTSAYFDKHSVVGQVAASIQDPRFIPQLEKSSFNDVNQIYTLLARHGEAVIPPLCILAVNVLEERYSAQSEFIMKALILSDLPEVGSTLMLMLDKPWALPLARVWVQRTPDPGLSFLSETFKEHALPLLKEFVRTEHAQLQAILPTLSGEAQKRLKNLLSHSSASAEAPTAQLPAPLQTPIPLGSHAWCQVSELPEVFLKDGKHFLSDEARATLFHLCRSSKGHLVYQALEPASFSAFLLAMLRAWQRSDDKDKAILVAVGQLSDEPTARQYMKTVEGWASSSGGFHNATAGLRGLALRGDAGLRLVHRMSLKAKSQGLRRNAAGALDSAARERGLSRIELEDRLVPDLDLAADGSCLLDFGPRQFRVGFDENLRPVVKDEAGKALKDLPKATKTDDAEKSTEATERWKQLKKDVRELAALQLPRLEIAFVDERRWKVDAFLSCFVRHPLMQHLSRRLLWGAFGGTQVACFRIAEDGSLADMDDNPFELPGGVQIGMIHPLRLTHEQKEGWTKIFADYGLLQPFPQLSRPTFSLGEDERNLSELKQFVGRKIPGGRILGQAGKPGWQKGGGVDNGYFETIRRSIPNRTESLEVYFSPGVSIMGGDSTKELQDVRSVRLRPGKFENLGPVLISEIIRELENLTISDS